MNIETKYSIGQEVFTLLGLIKKVHRGQISKISADRWIASDGLSGERTMYSLMDGTGPLLEKDIFPTRQSLLDSL